MKIKTRKDALYLSVYILIILALSAAIVGLFFLYMKIAGQFLIQVLIALMIFLCGLEIYRVFFALLANKIETKEDGIIIKSGKTVTPIPFTKILKIENSKKLLVKNAMAIDKIEILYIDGNQKSTIYVTPKNKEEFVSFLKEHCHSMKNNVK